MADKQINLTDFLRKLKEKQKNLANQDAVYIDRDRIPFTTIEVTGQCGNTTVTDYEEVAYKREILALPAADVRPVVRGHLEEDENTYIFCSECGCNLTLAAYETPDGNLILRPRFCPNCGASLCNEEEQT